MQDPRLIEHFFQRDAETLFWMFGFAVALILLFIFARLLRNVAGGRVRQVEEFGMDFDSVSDMLDKNLLTPEEAKRVKSVLARHFKDLYDKPKSPSKASGLSADEELAVAAEQTEGAPDAEPRGPERQPERPPEAGAAPSREPATGRAAGPPPPPPITQRAGEPPSPETAPAAAPKPETPPDEETVDVPIDVMDMYRAGTITREEFEALRRYYAARAHRDG